MMPGATTVPVLLPEAGVIALLTAELLIAVLAWLTGQRDLGAAARVCRHFRQAASDQAAWRRCWSAVTTGKVYIPPRALALVSTAPEPQYRSALKFALRDAKRVVMTKEEVASIPVWEVRSKPSQCNDRSDPWLRGKPCIQQRYNRDTSVTMLRGAARPAGEESTRWRFVRRCNGKIVPFGTVLRTRVTVKGGQNYDLPSRRVMRRAFPARFWRAVAGGARGLADRRLCADPNWGFILDRRVALPPAPACPAAPAPPPLLCASLRI